MRRPGTCLRVFTAYILTRNSRLGLRSPFRTQMVAGPECLFLCFAMRRPGTCLRVSTAYILTRNSRLGSGWCVGGPWPRELHTHLRRLGLSLGTTRMVGAGRGADCSGLECLTLGFGMRRPGTHIPRTYRVHPDQKQLFGLRQGLEAAGVVGGGVGPGPWECAVRVAIAAEVLQ